MAASAPVDKCPQDAQDALSDISDRTLEAVRKGGPQQRQLQRLQWH